MPNRPVVVPPHHAERILEQRTRLLAARGADAAPAEARRMVLACQSGGEFYGLPLSAVAQVLPRPAWTPLPGAPPAMLGLFARAGQMFCLLDLTLALGQVAAKAEAEGGSVLLLRAPGPRRFALRVGRLAGAFAVTPLEGEGQAAGRAIAGHALAPPELAGGRRALLGLIDPDRLLQPFMASAVPSGA